MITTNPAPHKICAEYERLLAAERALRAEAKSTRAIQPAARLADAAIDLQRRRFAHQEECAMCLRLVPARAA